VESQNNGGSRLPCGASIRTTTRRGHMAEPVMPDMIHLALWEIEQARAHIDDPGRCGRLRCLGTWPDCGHSYLQPQERYDPDGPWLTD
jgi:hypothetical protein